MSRALGAVRPFACLALLSFLAAACTEWRVQTAPVAKALAEPAAKARVTLRDGRVLELRDVHLEADSLVGQVPADSVRFAVPVRSVHQIELLEPSRERSTALGLGIFVLFSATFIIVLLSMTPYT